MTRQQAHVEYLCLLAEFNAIHRHYMETGKGFLEFQAAYKRMEKARRVYDSSVKISEQGRDDSPAFD